jgi:ABC-type branched-subunit amino acid transport system substrate-binding protein
MARATAGGGGKSRSFSLTVGDLVPLTGDLSVQGPSARAVADLAVAQIAKAAKAAGVDTKVSVAHADTESQAQGAVQGAQKVIAEGATCLTGPRSSAETLAVAQSLVIRRRIPLISDASTSAQITTLQDGGYVFRTVPSDVLQAKALADVVAQQLGGTNKTLSLAARNDAYGQGLIDRFKGEWEAKGGTTTGAPVLYDPQQPAYNSEAGRIVARQPDAYVIIDFPDTFAKMGAALVRTGRFDAKAMFTADGLGEERIPSGIPKPALVGARGTRPGTPQSGALVKDFDQLYASSGGPPRQLYEAQKFDAVVLCYLAALAADSSDGSAIQSHLREVSGPPGRKYDFTHLTDAIKALAAGHDIDYEGVSGPVDFDANGDPTSATYDVFDYGGDGRLHVMRQYEARSRARG